MSEIKIAADSGGGTVSLKGPATTTGNAALTYTLPDATTGGVLRTTTTPGAIVAVKQAVKSDQWTYNTIDTWVDVTGLSISHALANSSNKLLLSYSISCSSKAGAYNLSIRMMDDTTVVAQGDADGSVIRTGNMWWAAGYNANQGTLSNQFLYAPGNTDTNAYHVEARTHYGESIYINRTYDWNNGQDEYGSTVSTITLMEVAA